jgi:hypothetical protein
VYVLYEWASPLTRALARALRWLAPCQAREASQPHLDTRTQKKKTHINTHIHTYTHKQAAALQKAGVDAIVCVAHGDPVEVFSWAAAAGADGSCGVSALADRDGSFARMLGVEAPPGAPYSTHRYAALVEDGILLKLKVDDKPGECVKTRGEELLDCARQFFVH